MYWCDNVPTNHTPLEMVILIFDLNLAYALRTESMCCAVPCRDVEKCMFDREKNGHTVRSLERCYCIDMKTSMVEKCTVNISTKMRVL